ncbi:MAG: flagellar basal body P-ring formation protein FlgA [Silicimonas sp.]|nr:flagellar basal body P-ring formation protein FlgA [Silicimonas sp.]
MIRGILTILIAAVAASSAGAEMLTVARVIRPQALIAPEDISVTAASIPGALGPAADIVGLEAKVTLYPGRPILPGHVGPPALVERNQSVLIVFQTGALTILADARALSRGAVGDTVRVMNLASRTTISGQVQSDGSVIVSRGAHR